MLAHASQSACLFRFCTERLRPCLTGLSTAQVPLRTPHTGRRKPTLHCEPLASCHRFPFSTIPKKVFKVLLLLCSCALFFFEVRALGQTWAGGAGHGSVWCHFRVVVPGFCMNPDPPPPTSGRAALTRRRQRRLPGLHPWSLVLNLVHMLLDPLKYLFECTAPLIQTFKQCKCVIYQWVLFYFICVVWLFDTSNFREL